MPAFSQISPPGLDDTRAVAWGAIGFSQQIGPKWQTTIYLGASRESNPDNYSLLNKPAIAVIDVSGLYRFNDRWSLSGAISFRKQDVYDVDDMEIRDEIRYYSRLYYRHKIKKISFTYSFRPEFRTYYNSTSVPYTYRFRLKAQVAIPLNQSGSNQFILGNEILNVAQPHFSDYKYSEDRLTSYFRHTFKKPAVIFDAGFMYQFLAGEGLITHLAFDVIFLDPFGKHSLN
ncbi:MAG: DUF2490 domain-containing protein [Bacteroidota bacterium]